MHHAEAYNPGDRGRLLLGPLPSTSRYGKPALGLGAEVESGNDLPVGEGSASTAVPAPATLWGETSRVREYDLSTKQRPPSKEDWHSESPHGSRDHFQS